LTPRSEGKESGKLAQAIDRAQSALKQLADAYTQVSSRTLTAKDRRSLEEISTELARLVTLTTSLAQSSEPAGGVTSERGEAFEPPGVERQGATNRPVGQVEGDLMEPYAGDAAAIGGGAGEHDWGGQMGGGEGEPA
jgi:hypothetical protein